MAKKKVIKKQTRGHNKNAPTNPFPKGNKLAKGHGRPPMNAKEKSLALRNRTELKLLIGKYASWSLAEINEAIEDENLPIIDIAILCAIRNAVGVSDKIDWVLNHIMGRPKEETNINLRGGLENTSTIDLKKLTREQLLQLQTMVQASEE